MPKEYQHKTIAGFFAAHRDRWIKGDLKQFRKNQARFCLVGKVKDLYPDDEHERIYNRLAYAIKKMFPITYQSVRAKGADQAGIVVEFNDAKHRRIQDIIDVALEARI